MANSDFTVESTVLTLKLIIATLTLGVALFAAFAIYHVDSKAMSHGPDLEMPLLKVLFGLAIALSIAYPLLRRNARNQVRKHVRGDSPGEAEPKILRTFTTVSIMGAAMVEGPTFFALIIFLTNGDKLALLAGGVGIALLLAQWPTEARYRRFASGIAGSG